MPRVAAAMDRATATAAVGVVLIVSVDMDRHAGKVLLSAGPVGCLVLGYLAVRVVVKGRAVVKSGRGCQGWRDPDPGRAGVALV